MTTLQRQETEPDRPPHRRDIENLGRELDAIRQQVLDEPRRARRRLHPQASSTSSASSNWAAAPCCCSRCFRLHGWRALPGSRSRRSSRTWRSATTSCTASGTGCATTRSTPPPGSGTTPPRPTCGSTRTTRSTTPTPTSSARTTTSATAIMRVDEDQRWMPFYLAQPLWNFINALLLRVRHRGLRPRDRQDLKGTQGPIPSSRPRQIAAQDPPPGRPRTTSCTRCCPARRPSPRSPPT